MDTVICDDIYRKIFLLDDFEGETDVYHSLLTQHDNYRYLITGPSNSGRTSLAFETAFQAAERGLHVLYITCKQITALPHFHGKRAKPDTETLSRIQLLYPKTYEECLSVLGSLHKTETGYSLIIVDDLEEFFTNKDRLKLTQCCSLLMAVLVDTIAFCKQKTGKNGMLLCVMSYNSPLYSALSETAGHFVMNEIRFYPPPIQRHRPVTANAPPPPSFVMKSECNVVSLKNQIDIDIVGVQARFEEGRVFLK